MYQYLTRALSVVASFQRQHKTDLSLLQSSLEEMEVLCPPFQLGWTCHLTALTNRKCRKKGRSRTCELQNLKGFPCNFPSFQLEHRCQHEQSLSRSAEERVSTERSNKKPDIRSQPPFDCNCMKTPRETSRESAPLGLSNPQNLSYHKILFKTLYFG